MRKPVHYTAPPLKNLFLKGVVLFISACAIVACVDSGGNSAANNDNKPLQGIVMKGPVESAAVRLYTIKSDGSRDTLLVDGGPFKTEKSPTDPLPGRWGAPAVDSSVPLIVVARGGSYIDEGTQGTIKLLNNDLLGFKARFSNPAVAVTPITHALLLQAKSQMLAGVTPADALKQVLEKASDSFGFNVVETQPRNPLQPPVNLTNEQKNYTALLGGLSNLLDPASNTKLAIFQGKSFNSFDLVVAFAQDLADGDLDGAGIDNNGNVLNTIPINDIDGARIADFPALTTATNGIDVLFAEAYAWAQNSANLSTVNSLTFPTRALRFSGAAADFSPTITPNADSAHPVISWVGGSAVAIRVNRKSNTNPLAPAAWVIGGQSFASPVTYFITPQGAFPRPSQMTNNGAGEPDLAPNVIYQIRVTLTDNTSGVVDYSYP